MVTFANLGSIRLPSLKFVDLCVRKIRRIYCVSQARREPSRAPGQTTFRAPTHPRPFPLPFPPFPFLLTVSPFPPPSPSPFP